MRVAMVCVLAMMAAGSAAAQVNVAPGASEQKADVPEFVLTMEAAAEPRPALKYQLLPAFAQQTDGNAATLYYQAQALLARDDPNFAERVAEWVGMEPDEMPLEEVRAAVAGGSVAAALRNLDYGALCTQCDWGVPIRQEGMSVLLPSLSSMRALARLNILRARLAWLDGDYPAAVGHLASSYQLARHLGEMPTLISCLVGQAIVALSNDELLHMSAAAGAPNLYWALADLPDPIVPWRRALEGERSFLEMTYPLLAEIDRRPLADSEWNLLAARLAQVDQYATAGGWKLDGAAVPREARLRAAALATATYPLALENLKSRGYSQAEVDAMSPQELFVRYWWGDYRYWRSELLKWFTVPYHEASERIAAVEQRLAEAEEASEVGLLTTILLPSLSRAAFVRVKIERDVAATMVIQALRGHVAAHGALPETLDEVEERYIPPDPVHGRPFQYTVEGDTFTLESAGPDGRMDRDAVRYVVTIVKAGA